MSLREFTDERGVEWRVWDITPDTAPGATRIEDYLQGFLDGWLVFERADGGEKRRLYPLPARWEQSSDEELGRLLEGAASVSAPESGARAGSRADSQQRRTFSYPGGEQWTVVETPAIYRDRDGRSVDSGIVLRFSSGARNLDLLAWPRDWAERSDEELAELLWRAFPRQPEGAGDEAPARRRGESPRA